MRPTTIISIDDHPLIREAIKGILRDSSYELVAEGDCGEDVIPLLEAYQPDVLLLDLGMPQTRDQNIEDTRRFSALPVISQIEMRFPKTNIIILTQYYIPVLIQGAIERGVAGYILKSDNLSLSLLNAIETVVNGSVYFSESISQRLFRQVNEKQIPKLTNRQLEVLTAIYTNPDSKYQNIAAELGISIPAVKQHLTRAFIALGVTNKTSAIIKCRELGLIVAG